MLRGGEQRTINGTCILIILARGSNKHGLAFQRRYTSARGWKGDMRGQRLEPLLLHP